MKLYEAHCEGSPGFAVMLPEHMAEKAVCAIEDRPGLQSPIWWIKVGGNIFAFVYTAIRGPRTTYQWEEVYPDRRIKPGRVQWAPLESRLSSYEDSYCPAEYGFIS